MDLLRQLVGLLLLLGAACWIASYRLPRRLRNSESQRLLLSLCHQWFGSDPVESEVDPDDPRQRNADRVIEEAWQRKLHGGASDDDFRSVVAAADICGFNTKEFASRLACPDS